ncbi:MAG: M28 family peptidase [Burkholderiales bacterium]
MQRRAFMVATSGTVLAALADLTAGPNLLFAKDMASLALEQRLADIVATYDAQGNHRTGTPADNASAEWLTGQVRQMGAEAALEPFALSRVDPQSCYLRIADRRIEGVPLFDAAFTDADGVRGRLGLLGSDAEIGLAETEPFSFMEPRRAQAGVVAEARRSRHKAVVMLTGGSRPGLFLLNAVSFTKPSGPPTLQVSSVESEWLKGQAQRRAEVTLVAHVHRTAAQAFNVTAKITGSDPALAPLVLMAPRSAWWQSASEQGSRLACWLEAIRVLAAGNPKRDAFFVALSGHELGLLGIDAYLQRRRELVKQAFAWIFFGSDIGAPRQPNLIHASDDEFEKLIVVAMEKEGLIVNTKARHDTAARGEAGPVQRGGGRFVTVACDSEAFHSVADRWPEAIDVALLARYARAIASAALTLAMHQR